MRDKTIAQRVSVLETELKNLREDLQMIPANLEKVDARLRVVERSLWVGIGALGLLQSILTFYKG